MSRVVKPDQRGALRFVPTGGTDERFRKPSAPEPAPTERPASGTVELAELLKMQAEQTKAMLAAVQQLGQATPPKPPAAPRPQAPAEYQFQVARNWRGLITTVTVQGGGETWLLDLERDDNGLISTIRATQA